MSNNDPNLEINRNNLATKLFIIQLYAEVGFISCVQIYTDVLFPNTDSDTEDVSVPGKATK